MTKTRKTYIFEGNVFVSIIKYSIPIMLASLVQVLFNAIDLAVVGNFASSVSVAAVGVTSPAIALVVSTVVGLSGGVNALLARTIGEGDEIRSRKIVGTAITVSLVAGIAIAVLGVFLTPVLLDALNCKPAYYSDAATYMIIYIAAAPAIFIYNFGAAIIRVSGDSTRPLYYVIASGLLNVVLNFILCLCLENKVVAVAVATLASQLLGAILVLIHLIELNGPCRLDIKHISFSWAEFGKILRYGIPTAFNNALFSLSNLQIQSEINNFGTEATAANAAAIQIEHIISCFTGAFSTAALVFIGQNLGAKNKERTKKSIFCSMALSSILSCTIGILIYLLGRPLLSIFLDNDVLALDFGQVRLKYILSSFGIAAVNGIMSSAVQAFGYPNLPMINSLVSVLSFRVVWMTWIYPSFEVTPNPVHNIGNIYSCYLFSWILCCLVNLAIFTVLYLRFKHGQVKKI